MNEVLAWLQSAAIVILDMWIGFWSTSHDAPFWMYLVVAMAAGIVAYRFALRGKK